MQVTGLTNVTAAAGGDGFSVALKSDGTIVTWGTNGNGQLGDGTTTSRVTPGAVLSISTAAAVAVGDYHTLALLANGTVRSWGSAVTSCDPTGSVTALTSLGDRRTHSLRAD